ncbi:MAG TPA: lysophospholipid acyltransferase family protein [Mesorhizobium sp.]|jgi:1-acyl-sn-glycerol-3-phosphate acyltransferase
MIGCLRIAMAFAFVGLVTPFVALAQLVAMKTGWFPETIFPPLWHSAIVRALGLRIRVFGAPSDQRPLLIAANHISWADIMVIGSLFDVQFIAKSEMSGWPIMGFLSKLQRTVFVERERRRKSGEQASEIATRLKAGHAMILFPEGTTADGNFILPFKTSLFGAASMALDEHTVDRVYVQPLAIAYTRVHGVAMGRKHRALFSWAGGEGLWPSLKRFLSVRAVDVELHFGAPIEFAASRNRKAVARQAEDEVRRLMSAAISHPR